MASTDTKRIERRIELKAPRARVWQGLTDTSEFGSWFGVNLAGQSFVADQRVSGHITHPGYEHLRFDALVERVEHEGLLSLYWHPYPIDPEIDYDREKPTLVTFTLQDTPGGGTLVTVVESGFEKVPAARREEAFRMNSQGWDAQMQNLAGYVGG